MKLLKEDVRGIERMTVPKLSDWILEGLKGWASGGVTSDSFYPHSFINLFDTPVTALCECFTCLSASAQTRFRKSTARALHRCLPSMPDLNGISLNDQLIVIYSLLSLAEDVVALEALSAVVTLASGALDKWQPDTIRHEIYGKCLATVGHLALAAGESYPTPKRYERELSAAIYRMVSSVFFRVQHAPFCLASLISVTPANLADHLDLLGRFINELHESTPDQQSLAVHTAYRIAKHARYYLKQHFHRLSFRTERSRDTWLIDALIHPDGPFELVRSSDALDSPTLVSRDPPDQAIVLQHKDWTGYDQPPLSESQDSGKTTGPPWEQSNLFRRPERGATKSEHRTLA